MRTLALGGNDEQSDRHLPRSRRPAGIPAGITEAGMRQAKVPAPPTARTKAATAAPKSAALGSSSAITHGFAVGLLNAIPPAAFCFVEEFIEYRNDLFRLPGRGPGLSVR